MERKYFEGRNHVDRAKKICEMIREGSADGPQIIQILQEYGSVLINLERWIAITCRERDEKNFEEYVIEVHLPFLVVWYDFEYSKTRDEESIAWGVSRDSCEC